MILHVKNVNTLFFYTACQLTLHLGTFAFVAKLYRQRRTVSNLIVGPLPVKNVFVKYKLTLFLYAN